VSGFERKRRYVLVFLATTLCSTVVLKVGAIQYLELIFAADLIVLAALTARRGLEIRLYRPFLEIAKSYGIFLIAAFVLCLFALRQDFPGAANSGIFKKPVVVTVARMAELFLDVFYMLYLASLFREDERLCRFGAKTYCWAGIAGCLYSFATLPLNVLYGAQLGTYVDLHRFRGFNNEGGGFGMHLLTVGALMIVIYQRKWISRRQFLWGLAIVSIGFLGSRSKSGLFALALVGILNLLWLYRGWKRWTLVASLCAGLIAVSSVFSFQAAIDAYIRGSEQYQKMSNLRAEDANFVMGRISGAVLAPRMIKAHPLIGIGWGNYPLVRDNPEYRRGTAFSLGSVDAPNLGIFDYLVDLGFPLWLYLIWIELKPMVMLMSRRADHWLVNLAFMLPLSNWAGVHLNLIHPWIVVAFALGLGFQVQGRKMLSEASTV
jgi:hypothetical protein